MKPTSWFLLASLPSTISAAGCSGVIGIIASAVAGIPQAQTFCSQKYPAPSSTVTGATATVTAPASTAYVTAPPSTVTQTVTGATVVSSTTTTTVTDVNGPYKKRAPEPADLVVRATTSKTTVTSTSTKATATPTNSALNSLLTAAAAVASSVCRCIQPAKVTTTVPKTTVTPTTTLQTTSVTTTTFTAVSTSTAADVATSTVTVSGYYDYSCSTPLVQGQNADTSCGTAFGCYCYTDRSGQNYCIDGYQDAGASCTTDAQCGDNHICANYGQSGYQCAAIEGKCGKFVQTGTTASRRLLARIFAA